MPYAALSDATDLYGTDYVTVSFDRDNDGVADVAVYTAAFDRATSEINGMLAGSIDLPLATVPDDLVAYCVDIAIYYGSITCDVLTEHKRDLFKQARDAIKATALNMRKLGLEKPPPNRVAGPQVSASDRVLTRDSLGKVW